MFIQFNWAKSNLEVQRMRYNLEVSNVLVKSVKDITNRLGELNGLNPNRFPAEIDPYFQTFNNRLWNNVHFLKPEEIEKIIRTHLDEEKIKLPFAYCITHQIIGLESYSPNFNTGMFEGSYNLRASENGYMIHLYIEEPNNYIYQRSSWMFASATLFSIIIITAFAVTLRTMFNQKKLSEIKSDFINNMTHEFKTPLATISLASDALSMEKVQNNKDMLNYYAGIIKSENKRMNKQVETILQAAQIDRNELKLNLQSIDVHEVINKMVDTFTIQVAQRNGNLTTHLNAEKHTILGDEVHFSNIIYNLMDNAVKYSKDKVELEVSTSNTKTHLIIKIKDNGIGMSKETQSKIFEKFYRAHTGNIHDIKGFGLGLSYVKTIVDNHKGQIKVESNIGKGSIFTIELPLHS